MRKTERGGGGAGGGGDVRHYGRQAETERRKRFPYSKKDKFVLL